MKTTIKELKQIVREALAVVEPLTPSNEKLVQTLTKLFRTNYGWTAVSDVTQTEDGGVVVNFDSIDSVEMSWRDTYIEELESLGIEAEFLSGTQLYARRK